MKIWDKIKAAMQIVRAVAFHKQIPVAIRWELTFRCNNRCLYCNLWKGPFHKELTLEEIKRIGIQFIRLGTRRISLSGGEPMLRDDIGEIIDFFVGYGLSVSMNTNGFRVAERIEDIKNLDLIKISLDGSKEVHNFLAGNKYSYDLAIDAAKAARSKGIQVVFTTTLTRYNLDEIPFMVDLAGKMGAMVAFQPFKSMYKGVKNIAELVPEPSALHKAVSLIEQLKKEHPNLIRNSFLLIEHIKNWPEYKQVPCRAGQIFFIINPDGTLLPCDRADDYTHHEFPNLRELSFKEAMKRLPKIVCNGCGFLGAQELNYFSCFKLDFSMLHFLNKLK